TLLLLTGLFGVQQDDTFAGEERLELVTEAPVLFVHQLVDARGDRSHSLHRRQPVGPGGLVAGTDAALEPRHTHHEELVEVRAEDAQKFQALEQGHAWILCLLEHAAVELEPRQLSIDERVRVHRARFPLQVSRSKLPSPTPRVQTTSRRYPPKTIASSTTMAPARMMSARSRLRPRILPRC